MARGIHIRVLGGVSDAHTTQNFDQSRTTQSVYSIQRQSAGNSALQTVSIDFKQLQATLTAHLQQQPTYAHSCQLQLLAHGEANIIFRLNRDRLVRIAVNTPNQRFQGEFQRVTQFEAAILRFLSGSGIGHELYAAQMTAPDDFPFTYLITNYLEGRSLTYSRADLQQAAQTLANLHRLPRSLRHDLSSLQPTIPVVDQPLSIFYREAEAYAQPYLDSPHAEAEVIERVQTVLHRAAQQCQREQWLVDAPYRCLVHSDHTYENWVIGSDRAYLIDWEWAEIGSPAGDLGHFLSPVTVQRRQGYQMPESDRDWFLKCYYDALEDKNLADTIRRHFAAFGVYPAVRSLCWTAGYWVTANRWYAKAEDSPSAAERLTRLEHSRQQFNGFYEAIMRWFDTDWD